VQLFRFSNLSKFPNLCHFITTRKGGVSEPPFDSLNLGFHTADKTENVISNWKILSDVSKIELDSLVIAHQVHQGRVVVADHSTIRGAWSDPTKEIDNTDAFITKEKNICIMVKVADCVPILVYDPVLHIAAAIHAGWKGTVNSVTANTIKTLINTFNCKPQNLIAGIGPSIGPCCYQIGIDVEKAILEKWGTTEKFLVKTSGSIRSNFDLWYANRFELIRMGVKSKNIESAGVCSRCNSELYFSVRASGGNTGRFCAGIMLK
jgi:polyphenol oxidase